MRVLWEYSKTAKGIRICRAYASQGQLTVPEEIDGIRVVQIGPYAFSEAELPGRFRPAEVFRAEIGSGLFDTQEELPAVCGARLLEIALPSGLIEIGDYAFYGCRALTKIRFTDSLKRIGSGAFTGCNAVRKLDYKREAEPGPRKDGLYAMLSELRFAIEVVTQQNGVESRLIYPEYMEAAVENTPARIFETHFQGTGYRYRQCFQGAAVDYRTYDDLFALARVQEPPETLAMLAYDRLKYPEDLTEEAREMYLEFFSRQVKTAGACLLAQDKNEEMRFLLEAGAFDLPAQQEEAFVQAAQLEAHTAAVAEPPVEGTADFYMNFLEENGVLQGEEARRAAETEENRPAYELLIELAAQQKKTEAMGILLDWRHRKLGPSGRSRKVFDL